MKRSTHHKAPDNPENDAVFTASTEGLIQRKLLQWAEIEWLFHSKNSSSSE